MADIIFNSFLSDVFAGNCNTTHTYKGILTASTHTKRSDVTGEVSGTGYTAGGNAVTLSAAVNNSTNVLTLTIGAVSWPSSTITARKLIVYRARGGAASADELVCCVDNGTDLVSSNTTLSFAASTWEITLPAAT
jgi:hypothetical protein